MKKLEKPIEKPIDAYKEILALIEKCAAKVELDYSVSNSCIYTLKSLIEKEEVSEKFQIKVFGSSSDGWYNLNTYEHIGLFGAKYKRTISCSDDGSQPEDEWLYKIGFSTGPYALGSGYPERIFSEFFNELKRFGPKFIDSMNKSLYFTSEVAAKVHEAFPEILKKYQDKALADSKETRIAALQKQIKDIETGSL